MDKDGIGRKTMKTNRAGLRSKINAERKEMCELVYLKIAVF